MCCRFHLHILVLPVINAPTEGILMLVTGLAAIGIFGELQCCPC